MVKWGDTDDNQVKTIIKVEILPLAVGKPQLGSVLNATFYRVMDSGPFEQRLRLATC